MKGGDVVQAILLIVGAVCVVLGSALLAWPAGVLALGVLALAAAVDLRP